MKNTFKSLFLLCIFSFMLQSCSDSTSSEDRRRAQAERDRKAREIIINSEAMKVHPFTESPTAEEDMRRRESEWRQKRMEAELKRQQMELDEMKERMHKQETDREIDRFIPNPLPTRLSPLEP